MAVGSERGSANRAKSRGRGSRNGSSGSSGPRASSRQSASRQSGRGPSQQTRSRAGRSRGNARAAASSARTSLGSSRAPSSNHRSQSDQSGRGTLASIGIPVVTGAIGVAGGVLLGRTALQRNKKILGVALPTKIDLADVSHQIGEAGRQFGKLAHEVKSVREKAEQVGRAST
jgi:hypothetical protein